MTYAYRKMKNFIASIHFGSSKKLIDYWRRFIAAKWNMHARIALEASFYFSKNTIIRTAKKFSSEKIHFEKTLRKMFTIC